MFPKINVMATEVHNQEHSPKQIANTGESAESGGLTQSPPPFQLLSSPIPPVVQRRVTETTEGLAEGGHTGTRSSPAETTTETPEEEPLAALVEAVPELAPVIAPEGRPIDDSMRTEARERYRIPERGWDDHVRALDRPRNMNLARAIDDLSELIRNNPEVIAHIRRTIDAFADDPDPASRIRPEDIDLPLILSIANRESMGRPVYLPPAGANAESTEAWASNRVTTGGGDAISGGVGGLDNMGNRIDRFPTSMREDVRSVMDVPSLRARIRPNRMGHVNPAEVPQADLLAAYIAGVQIYRERFERQFRQRVTRGNAARGQALTQDQANQMLAAMSADARRAWIQASFGSQLSSMLSDVTRPMLARYLREFRGSTPELAFGVILNDDSLNLNAIITTDTAMEGAGLSGHRTRLTAAESYMMEESLPPDLLNYRHGEPDSEASAPEAALETPALETESVPTPPSDSAAIPSE